MSNNVVMIMADSWQFNYFGCYGNDWIKTPNIDKLAKESVLFENAYAEGLPTIPVRRALATGRFTLPDGGWRPLTPEDTTMADILWRHHVQTALIADTSQLHLPKYGYERGFDTVIYLRGQAQDPFYFNDELIHLNPDDYHKALMEVSSDGEASPKESEISRLTREELKMFLHQRQYWTSDEDQFVAKTMKTAMNYLDNVDRGRPFFLWVDTFDPHEPWDPPSVYNPDMKCPYDPDYEGKDLIQPVPGHADAYTEEELHHIRMLYAEKITMVDKWIGKLLDRIRELGMNENTLIIFLSDHGEPLGHAEHGHGIMKKCRPWPYEELSHIPLIIRHPEGIRKRVPALVQTADIAPTIFDFLAVQDKRIDFQGESLLPIVLGKVEQIRDFAIAGYHNMSWSIITDDWFYVHWLHEGQFTDDQKAMIGFYGDHIADVYGEGLKISGEDSVWSCTPGSSAEMPETDELYDRKKDPFQLNNLIRDEPEIANDLFTRLREVMLELRST